MSQRIVTIIGTDGSGKTTLSDRVAEQLSADGCRTERVWLGAESVVMALPRRALKVLWKARRGGSSTSTTSTTSTTSAAPAADYRQEIARKNDVAARFAFATRLYVALALADYKLQIGWKLLRKRRLDVVVADRYVFDVVVNIGLVLGWSPDQVVSLARRQLARFPTPQVRVFLRVEPEVSLSRKDDIPDIDYLRLRLRHYDAIAEAFGFEVLDGTEPIDVNCERLLHKIRDDFDKPYVHYVHSNNTDVGGADRVLALMAAHAQTPSDPDLPSYRVTVSLREETPVVGLYRAAGIPVLMHPFVRPQVSGRASSIAATVLRAPAAGWHFWRMLGRERPDVVHVNDLYDFLPATAAKARRIPVVYHLRMIKSGALRTGFARLVPRLAPVSVSVSRAVRDHYFPHPAGAHRALVVHDLGNASLMEAEGDVSTPGPRPAGVPAGGRLVVMVGRVEPWKGQDVFLDAVRRLPPDVRDGNVFVLVGGSVPGSEEFLARVSADADDLGVVALGERTDVPEILRSADVSVHCSTAPDPFPGVVVESLLAGAATVAANAGGVPEMVTDGRSGLLTAPGDAAELARVIEGLLSAEETPRSRFAESGREAALAVVHPSVVDGEIAGIYTSLVPRSGQALRLREGSTRGAEA